jgi:hypothetical protein
MAPILDRINARNSTTPCEICRTKPATQEVPASLWDELFPLCDECAVWCK